MRAKPSKSKIPKISSAKFTNQNGADGNRVFLYETCQEPPFIQPVKGWKIVGYGEAPWPGSTESFAVMLEKQTPADEKRSSMKGEHFHEGTRIWQHYQRSWIFDEEEETKP